MSTQRITSSKLLRMKQDGEKIAVLTCYDASFAELLEGAGVEVLLVGVSLGMVVQGRESTLPVTLDDMLYHTKNVTRAVKNSLLIADMPFMTYGTPEQALENAGRLMKAGGAHMVKLEGGRQKIDIVVHLVANSIPVCAHLGLLPQSVYQLGGYKVQGRDEESARKIQEDALALQGAGASMLVLECVPASLATQISKALEIPVIGIGAGAGCDGQVLVLYDLLGVTAKYSPRFVKNFLTGTGDINTAVAAYVAAVKDGSFPGSEHSF